MTYLTELTFFTHRVPWGLSFVLSNLITEEVQIMELTFRPTMEDLCGALFAQDKFGAIVAASPRFLGFAGAISEKTDRYVSAFTDDQHLLVRGTDGQIRCFLNTCRHRNAQLVPLGHMVNGKMVTRTGKVAPTGAITCPLHRLTYDEKGTLRTALAFPKTPCLKLHEVPIEMVGGLIFETGRGAYSQLASVMDSPGFKKFGITPFARAAKMALGFSETSEEDFGTVTFMEVFGDTDHVDDIHVSSFHQQVDMSTLELEYGEDWSVQFVGWREKTTTVAPEYQRYRGLVLARGGKPKFGAVWMSYGPNMTFEWYPLGKDESGEDQTAFVTSVCIPNGMKCKIVVEFYFPASLLATEEGWNLAQALRDAYMLTAEEDRYPCISMEKGRRTLVENKHGDEGLGPIGPQEGCVAHYYNLLGRRMKALAQREACNV